MTRRMKAALGGTVSLGMLAWSASAALAAGAPAAVRVDDEVTVTLAAVDGSEAAGEARLEAMDEGQTAVHIHLHGVPAETALTAYLVAGSCAEPGEVQAALGAVVIDEAGMGNGGFRIDESLDQLVATPRALQLHAVGDEPGETLLCGDVPSGTAAIEAEAAADAVVETEAVVEPEVEAEAAVDLEVEADTAEPEVEADAAAEPEVEVDA